MVSPLSLLDNPEFGGFSASGLLKFLIVVVLVVFLLWLANRIFSIWGADLEDQDESESIDVMPADDGSSPVD